MIHGYDIWLLIVIHEEILTGQAGLVKGNFNETAVGPHVYQKGPPICLCPHNMPGPLFLHLQFA